MSVPVIIIFLIGLKVDRLAQATRLAASLPTRRPMKSIILPSAISLSVFFWRKKTVMRKIGLGSIAKTSRA